MPGEFEMVAEETRLHALTWVAPISLPTMSIDLAAAFLARPSAPQRFADGGGFAICRQRYGASWTGRAEQPYALKLRLLPMQENGHEQRGNADYQEPSGCLHSNFAGLAETN